MPPNTYVILHVALGVFPHFMSVPWVPMADPLEGTRTRGSKRIHPDIPFVVILYFLARMTQVLDIRLRRSREWWST